MQYGPFVLAYDEKLNPDLPPARLVTLAQDATAKPLGDNKFEAPIAFQRWHHEKRGLCAVCKQARRAGVLRFGCARRAISRQMMRFRWAANRVRAKAMSTVRFLMAKPKLIVVTFDGTKQMKIGLPSILISLLLCSASFTRMAKTSTMAAGSMLPAGKPKIQIKKTQGGAWETIGELNDYPATTATDNKGLQDGQKFTLKLEAPISLVALRAIGKPASGDDAKQAFSSCAELGAFEK